MRIAISGKMTSGKSLIAKHLADKYDFVELSFADKLKEIAVVLFPSMNYGKNRWLLIQVGEKLREIDSQVWIRALMKDIIPSQHVVISDTRFPLEYDTLKRLGFIMVRAYIDRETQIKQVRQIYPDMPLVLLDDYSEIALDHYPFDYIITNTEHIPLNAVYHQVDWMLKDIRFRMGFRYDTK